MIKKFYRLDYCDWDYFDEQDQEDVEKRYVIGFFDSLEKVNKAKEICRFQGKVLKKYLQVKEFFCQVGNRQKYLYFLVFDYSIFDGQEYTDYIYYLPPFSNKNKCKEYKKEMQKNEKFQVKPNYLYMATKDGFYIEKMRINEVLKNYAYNWRKNKLSPKDVSEIML